jgi:UDP-N-acetylglucosamine 4,6-dehydratase
VVPDRCKKFIQVMLKEYHPAKIIVYSRDELKQHEMRVAGMKIPACVIHGDIRDKERLCRAFEGVDVVIHAAALKQVPACEYNPWKPSRLIFLAAAT